ncbi:MAG: hypothetical protein ACKOXO_13020, partial [Cyanobium sp.]
MTNQPNPFVTYYGSTMNQATAKAIAKAAVILASSNRPARAFAVPCRPRIPAPLLALLSLLAAAPASAGPALLVNGYGTSLTQSACVEQARRIIETVGLTEQIWPSTVSGDDKQ